MDKLKLLTVTVIALLLLNICMVGFMIFGRHERPGFPPPPEHGGPNGGPKEMIIERLSFSKEQTQTYLRYVDEHKRITDSLSNAGRKLHDQLFELLNAESLDTLTSNNLIKTISENQSAIEKNNLKHFAQIKSLCTSEEQKEKFSELIRDLGKIFSPRAPAPPRD